MMAKKMAKSKPVALGSLYFLTVEFQSSVGADDARQVTTLVRTDFKLQSLYGVLRLSSDERSMLQSWLFVRDISMVAAKPGAVLVISEDKVVVYLGDRGENINVQKLIKVQPEVFMQHVPAFHVISNSPMRIEAGGPPAPLRKAKR